jgi:DNA-binding protein H-NS
MVLHSGGLLYDVNFIRAICRDLSRETNPEKTEELMGLLRAVMKEDREEFKARIKFLTEQYSHLLASSGD